MLNDFDRRTSTYFTEEDLCWLTCMETLGFMVVDVCPHCLIYVNDIRGCDVRDVNGAPMHVRR